MHLRAHAAPAALLVAREPEVRALEIWGSAPSSLCTTAHPFAPDPLRDSAALLRRRGGQAPALLPQSSHFLWPMSMVPGCALAHLAHLVDESRTVISTDSRSSSIAICYTKRAGRGVMAARL